ncbi:longitudinals lacking protein, isoforms H/M/V isoform X10 [Drosophila eugracilis]|uniref:longitudinals lacking protein, isoforms H/M/V isoform X10 n=1 Tax=Drosophila eugracilis TaxID=29029 RepID=UPI0007E66970|nr:longitudinals lacking protein, isoforms H/M/V isoform X10 [Drosophila eugracilis]
MDDDQQFCLRWNNHQSTLISVFDTLLENETLVDCTLAAEGKFLKAHKVVLSACSPYFATLLQEQYDKHPIFILKDVKYQELRAMMDYMYRGEVNISQDQLAALLKAAESLQIKGLSDNRTGGGSAPKPESSGQQHHRGGKLSGAYTLEQTKRARLATGGAMDASGDVSGSREGSSSPSRRRRKVRRRSMENDAHDNSNSSVLQAAASNQSILQQTGAGLAVSALVTTQLASGPAAGTSSQASSTQQQQPLTSTNVTKKTESAKLTSSTAAPASGASASAAAVQQAHLQQAQATSDAINTENVQAQSQGGAQGVQGDDDDMDEGSVIGGSSAASGPNPASASASAVHAGVVVKQLASVVDKSSSNHKQKIKDNSVSSVGSDMVIEPKAEYDDDAHDENVEDLTLDEEDMTMEELDQTAGTSQGGEGSSQTYAWQHDRSQDELGLMAQDAQQRDPQDIYPILGSLLGVDTSTSANPGSSANANDEFYGYHLNNNNTTSTTISHAKNNSGNGGNSSGGGGLSRDSFMQCKHCNRYYKSHQKLQEHVRKYCLKQKKYKCVSCEYRSRRKDHVLRHAKRKHCMLYEQSRDDEESLYVIRNEDDLSNDEEVGDGEDGDPEDGDPGGMDSDVAAALCEINFDFAGRDLTITAVPALQESEEDDEDYDDDG